MNRPDDTQIEIEVVYAAAERQKPVRLTVSAGTRVEAAIRVSGLLAEFPEIDIAVNAVGVWGKVVSLEHALREHDRVEIYRPLKVDPKQARVIRAQGTPPRSFRAKN
jgi:hypothetical protein